MNGHVEAVYEGNKPFKSNLPDARFSRKVDLFNILNQFMKERSHSNKVFHPVVHSSALADFDAKSRQFPAGHQARFRISVIEETPT